jgi:hypothetical protein
MIAPNLAAVDFSNINSSGLLTLTCQLDSPLDQPGAFRKYRTILDDGWRVMQIAPFHFQPIAK